MNKLKKFELYKLLQIGYSVFITVGIMILTDSWLGTDWEKPLLLLCAVIGQILVFFSEEKKYRILTWGIVITAIAIWGYNIYKMERDPDFYFMFLCISAVTIAVSFLCYYSQKVFFLKIPINIFLLFSMIYFSIKAYELSKWAVCVILLCILIFLTELAEKNIFHKTKTNALYLLPIFTCFIAMFLWLPVKDTPIKWETVKSFINAVGDKISALAVDIEYLFSGRGNTYSLNFTGYGSDGELAGSLLSSDSNQISIIGSKTNSPLYLSGNSYDYYTGSSWDQKAQKKPYKLEEYVVQYNQLATALSNSIYARDNLNEIQKYRFFEIRYEGLKTDNLFYSLYTENIVLPKNAKLKRNYGDSPSLTKNKNVGFQYKLIYKEVNYSDERIQNLLRQKAWNDNPHQTEVYDIELLDIRKQHIYDNYTVLPSELPKRVYDLADVITAGADNDYDRLKAIQAYLNTYTYSLETKKCPEGQDFTDYFLFESKVGYCTYFATAMAVLARCEGIPTRYVEGFVTSETCNTYQKVNLTSQNAHAWVEAYIDNIGWVPIEATPGYAESAEKEWIKPKPTTSSGTASMEKPDDTVITNDNVTGIEQNKSNYKTLTVQILVIISILICLLIFFVVLRYYLIKGRYTKASAYEKMKISLKNILFIGKCHGFILENGETLENYGEKINGKLSNSSMQFSDVCKIYQGVRFGNKNITQETLNSLENYLDLLQKSYLRSCGIIKKSLYYITIN